MTDDEFDAMQADYDLCGVDGRLRDFAEAVQAACERTALDAEREARTLRSRFGVASGWIVAALKVLDTLDPDDTHEADELQKLVKSGEVLALTTLANSKPPNVGIEPPGRSARMTG